jgi:hypothetical protein
MPHDRDQTQVAKSRANTSQSPPGVPGADQFDPNTSKYPMTSAFRCQAVSSSTFLRK